MKNALIFLIGVVSGATTAYFYVKKKCNDSAQAMLDDLEATYNERLERIEKQHGQIEEMNRKKDEIMADIEKKDAEKSEDAKNPEGYTDYSAIYKPDKKSEEPKSPIRIITEAEEENYVNDKGFSMVGLSGYKDGVVIDDETEEIVKDYESLLGNGCIDMIFNDYHDGDQFVILNEKENTVYDITVSEERFGDDYEPGENE